MRNRIFITLLFLALAPAAVSVKAQINDANEAMERGQGFFNRGQYELAIFEYRGALNWPGDHQARAQGQGCTVGGGGAHVLQGRAGPAAGHRPARDGAGGLR